MAAAIGSVGASRAHLVARAFVLTTTNDKHRDSSSCGRLMTTRTTRGPHGAAARHDDAVLGCRPRGRHRAVASCASAAEPLKAPPAGPRSAAGRAPGDDDGSNDDDDDGDRFVYVGNLDFFMPADDVEAALTDLLTGASVGERLTRVSVPGWDENGPRKARDEGKRNRGFAVLEFDAPEAARAAVMTLGENGGASIDGRPIRWSLGVTTRSSGERAGEAQVVATGEEQAAAREAALRVRERRAHNRRQRRRRRERDAAALEDALAELLTAHPHRAAAAADRGEAASTDRDGVGEGWWDDDAWRAGWGTLYSRWASRESAMKALAYDWSKCPEAADPAGSNKKGGAARGERKRLQVESFWAVMQATEAARRTQQGRQQTVVDFGCGTGNLILPLAAACPEVNFVGLDLNPRSVELLQKRAAAAGLSNVTGVTGLIEDYNGPCTLALALHVCGAGTDAVLLQAQARGAAFVVAPCCVGKLKDGGMKSVVGLKNALAVPSAAIDQTSGGSESVDEEGDATEGVVDELVVRPGGGRPSIRVIHPRSRWMRGKVQRPEYLRIAAAADWSGHQGVSALAAEELGRLPRAAKAAVELDRGAAAQEVGYGVRLMKMLHPGSGLKNDVIVGFPDKGDPLGEHVEGPAATWDACEA